MSSDLQNTLDALLSTPTSPPSSPPTDAALAAPVESDVEPEIFSTFVSEHVEAAVALATEMMSVSESDGVGAALDVASNTTAAPGLVEHATKLFVTHDPRAREALHFAPLERRQAHLVAPSSFVGTTAALGAQPGGSTPPEDRMDYWREDPLLNEHHEHWHLVYPMVGRPGPSGPQLGDRHGELFAYMHEQMLARYDAERLGTGLARVEAFDDYRSPAPQGYDPGNLRFWDGGQWTGFRARPAGASWSDLTGRFASRPGALIDRQAEFAGKLHDAASTGEMTIRNGQIVAVDANNLGNAAESNVASPDFYGRGDPDNNQLYGNHHNDGHIHWMLFDNVLPIGVMGTTATAVRDPIFFRWHKQVDSAFHAWQEQQHPFDFSDAPPVTIDPAGIELVGSDGTPTDALTTRLLTRTIHVQDETGDVVDVPIDYLACDDFDYRITVGNESGAEQDVALRIFLAPETEVEDRRAWIELDKFRVHVGTGGAVVERRSDQSSVVRKPALRPSDLTPGDEPDPATDAAEWCDCGWPYTLLLPRGTADGMGFQLMVQASPGADLTVPDHGSSGDDEKCSSISYCGLKDENYPDAQPMGYPFSRPFADSIMATIERTPSIAARAVTIIHVPKGG